jgi:S-formylglutathione hydrolase FrmB
MSSISLVSGAVPVLAVTLAVLLLVGAVGWGRRRALRRQLFVALPVGILGVVGFTVLGVAVGFASDDLPAAFPLWLGMIVLALALCVVGWTSVRVWQRIVGILAVLATTLSAGVLVNASYGYLPTVGSLGGTSAEQVSTERDLARLRSRSDADEGLTVQVTIPGTVSGFAARQAYVWLPPVWFRDPARRLPVVELLSGAPGSPADWTRAGGADTTAQAFAAAHDGVAPILVMPDSNGSTTADTECVDSPVGHAETYLTVDVPSYVEKHFGAATTPGSWAVGGLSEGGECSLMLALRHPQLFSTFADFSGLQGPTVGETMQPQATTEQLFGGSTAAYAAHAPVDLLGSRTYPGLGGWFEVGSLDTGPLQAQQQLVPLARSAGITTCAAVVPGMAHSFQLWTAAFQDSLPWMAHRLGLAPAPSSTSPATCA